MQKLFDRVKQAAYATYTDVKNRSTVLIKHNVEKAKVLDIYIDLQSSYFLLPENGIYYEYNLFFSHSVDSSCSLFSGCPVLCLDMGHIVFQQNKDRIIVKTLFHMRSFYRALLGSLHCISARVKEFSTTLCKSR